MNKLKMTALLLCFGASAMAQSFSPSLASEIKEGITIEVLEVTRAEKYGWDNLEVKYNLKNESNYDIQRMNFTIHLFDKDKNEIGTVDAHTFRVPKLSERTIQFVEVASEHVNADIDQFTAETTNLDVIIDGEVSEVVSIKHNMTK